VTHGTFWMCLAALLLPAASPILPARHEQRSAASRQVTVACSIRKELRCTSPFPVPVRCGGPDHRAVLARLDRRPGRAPQDQLREPPLVHPEGPRWPRSSGSRPWTASLAGLAT
jgi:hypothetical protein